MKKIYLQEVVDAFIKECAYFEILENLPLQKYIIQYEHGEYLTNTHHTEALFQIVVKGRIDIYFIRDDGTKYALSNGGTGYIIGDTALFESENKNIFVEAIENVTCIAFSIDKNRETLLNNVGFLHLIAEKLSKKIAAITTMNATPISLEERVITYMKFKCQNGVLKGMEHAAFHLHCSSRQLQRIMNQYEADGIVKKIGKGTYKLIKEHT